jgi:hypothetical protein
MGKANGKVWLQNATITKSRKGRSLGIMTTKELEAQVAALMAENTAMKAAAAARQHFTLKVSGKGALSVYGLGRFPVTLYKGQWNRLIENVENIKTFIGAHATELKDKPVAEVPAANTVKTA